MPKKEMEMHEECWGKHKRKKGFMMLILGLLILGNAYYNVVSWSVFVGIIIALAGLSKLLMPKNK